MVFHVLGIKELFGKNYNLDFLIEVSSEEELRKYFNEKGIVIVRLEEFLDSIEKFGKIQLIISDIDKTNSETTKKIIVKDSNVKRSYLLYTMAGFEIQNIKSLDSSIALEPITVAQNIKQWEMQIEQLKKQQIEIKKHKDVGDSGESFSEQDQQILQTQTLATQVIHRADVLLGTHEQDLSPQEITQLSKMVQELSKVKLGNNIERMKEAANQIITLLNIIEKRELNKLSDFEHILFEDSVVTNVDVAKEIQKYEKAENRKKLGGEQSTNDKFYVTFGKFGMYLKLIWKDVIVLFEQEDFLWKKIFLVFSSLLYILAIVIGIYISFSTKNTTQEINSSSVKTMMSVALAGLLVYVIKILIGKRWVYLLLAIPLGILLFIVIMVLIRNTFSL